jgi:putative FmdB family regulatory protein
VKKEENMPIYEYECKKCGERFEHYVRSRDIEKVKEDELKCPVCGAADPERVYSTFGTCSGSCGGSPQPNSFSFG